MNPDTTRKLTTRSPKDPQAPENRWETPPPVFAKLSEDFGPFNVDLMADGTNHLLPNWIGPDSVVESDLLRALTAREFPSYLTGASGFCNPIYDYAFVNRLVAACSGRTGEDGLSTTLLLPLRTTSDWWRFLLERAEDDMGGASLIAFCDRRICFYEDGHPRWNKKELAKNHYRADSAVFDSVIVHFERAASRGGASTIFKMWEVPPHVPKSTKVTL